MENRKDAAEPLAPAGRNVIIVEFQGHIRNPIPVVESKLEKSMPAEQLLDDNVLLEELRKGSSEAVEALFERFHGKIYGLSMSILKNESDAEEATQDVFLTVFQKAHTFKGNSALYSWIYRICVNACLMRLRGKRRQETVSIEEFMPVFTDEGMHKSPVEDWSKEVERKMLDKELGKVIKKFTDELSEKYRVVFVLSDVEGLSNEETAQILGLTVPAVKSRLHRARLYLREQLGRYLQEGKTA
jgi:RNA polymerase sigma-70 factor (ECF subfamily)